MIYPRMTGLGDAAYDAIVARFLGLTRFFRRRLRVVKCVAGCHLGFSPLSPRFGGYFPSWNPFTRMSPVKTECHTTIHAFGIGLLRDRIRHHAVKLQTLAIASWTLHRIASQSHSSTFGLQLSTLAVNR